MIRRKFLFSGAAAATVAGLTAWLYAPRSGSAETAKTGRETFAIVKSDAQWRAALTPDQYRVLREEATERPFSSALNEQKAAGRYLCAGCRLPLFTSDTKYDSGTGWPSFYDALPEALGFKTDYKLILPRTEYHCARCGGHQGHVFDDGPPPTGKRYCNNGVALVFEAA